MDVELLPFQATDDTSADAQGAEPNEEGSGPHQITAETAAEPTPITALAPSAATTQAQDAQDAPATTADGSAETPSSSTRSDLSADALFEGVDLEQAAQWSETHGAQVLGIVGQLERAREQLIEANKTRGDTHSGQRDYERVVSQAQKLVDEAAEQIEALSAKPEATEVRHELVETYFRLQRLIESYGGKPKTAENRAVQRRADNKDKELARRVRKAAGGQREGLSRGYKLLIFLVILVVARVGWYFASDAEQAATFKVERIQLPAGSGSFVQNDHVPTDKEALTGAPRIQMLGLTSSPEGLDASVFAITKNSDTIEHTYTWWENDQILTVENTGHVPAEKLTSGATYRVEAKVSDGKQSATATSDPLVFRAPGSDAK